MPFVYFIKTIGLQRVEHYISVNNTSVKTVIQPSLQSLCSLFTETFKIYQACQWLAMEAGCMQMLSYRINRLIAISPRFAFRHCCHPHYEFLYIDIIMSSDCRVLSSNPRWGIVCFCHWTGGFCRWLAADLPVWVNNAVVRFVANLVPQPTESFSVHGGARDPLDTDSRQAASCCNWYSCGLRLHMLRLKITGCFCFFTSYKSNTSLLPSSFLFRFSLLLIDSSYLIKR